jgi:mercuric ion transport protein
MGKREARYKRSFLAAAGGTAVVALCCFTPLLVLVLGFVGLSALTPYLDYVLFPALAVLLVVTGASYQKWRKTQRRLG